MPNDFTQQIIEEFRANDGRVGGPFEGARLLLLTTTGVQSGAPHTTPVGYYPDGAERVLVIGSAGGAPKHPDWYHNLVANPRVTVEAGVFTYEADAVVLKGAERDRLPGVASSPHRRGCRDLPLSRQALSRTDSDSGSVEPGTPEDRSTPGGVAGRHLRGERGSSAVLREVERLADELESHLTFEEEQLIPILDAPPA